MSKKMFLLFSHKLTKKQIEDARLNWNIEEFIYLPKELQTIWSNISPDLDSLEDILIPLKEFVKKNAISNDVLLIQGDFGACFSMVNFCKKLNLIPVYATTKRIVKEFEEDGKMIKKSIFEHRRFREYA